MRGLVTFDIETTIDTKFKRKANPFTGLNWTVLAGARRAGQQDLWRFGDQPPADGWLLPVLEGCRFLAGFNIKFDVLHAIYNQPKNLEAWMSWVEKGGLVWDCQLAEYLLNGMGQKEHMLSLDEVSPRYGGALKHDEVKALWGAGVNTHLIEPALLDRYLGGGINQQGEYQPGDLENTETVALGQIKRARECGQVNSILLNMGGLLGTIEMERNGMYVNKERGLEIAAVLETQVAELTAALKQYLPVLPFEFNWGSPRQKSALIFGGTVTWDGHEYDCADGTTVYQHQWKGEAEQPLKYAGKVERHYVLTDGTTRPMEGCTDFDNVVFYASGKNAGEAKTKNVTVPDLTKPKGRAAKVPFTFPRITTPKPEWAGADEGVWSTSAEVIEALGSRDIPFLKALAELQGLTKDLGTYYQALDPKTGELKGMLTLVGDDNIVHHSINHTSTVTGRLSCSNPNLQNLPKGNKSEVKSLFVSRWGSDGVIIQSDFSSLEVYVQAILTKCRNLIDDLLKGIDMHCMRLSIKEKMAYDEVVLLCKGDESKGIAPVKEWGYKRTGTKEFSFQRAYGAGPDKISETTGMSVEDIKALIEAESIRYPEIDVFYEALTDQIKANRRPTSTFVPHPTLPGKPMCQLGKSFYRTPDGCLYGYMESPSPDYIAKRKGGALATFSPTEIRNYVVQGTGGTFAKAALWLSVRAFYAEKNFGGLGLLVNQVHDAEYADAHKSVSLRVAATLHACMEGASDLIEFLFDWPLPVPVPSETMAGASMMDEARIPGMKELAAEIRSDLRVRYMGGFVPSFA